MIHHIHRLHVIPADYSKTFLHQIYNQWKDHFGSIPTTMDIRLYIKHYYHNFHRHESLQEVEILVPCGSAREQLSAVAADSIDFNLFARQQRAGFKVKGKFKQNCTLKCPICLESDHTRVNVILEPCGCIFHRECINLSTKYSSQCPLCYQTINKAIE